MHSNKLVVWVCSVAGLMMGWGVVVPSSAAESAPATVAFDIKPQSLASALNAFAVQSGQTILFTPAIAKGKSSHGVSGTLAPSAALAQMLAGTGLSASRSPDGMLLISPADAKEASATSGPPSAPSGAQKQQSQRSGENETQRSASLEEVTITGSRIPMAAKEGAHDVKVYDKEQIESSGQTTITDFLNTLPDVSTAVTEGSFQTVAGATTVQLHGLPIGTTLVLVNGRRVESSGLQTQNSREEFFDLNDIPVAAVERIEVVSEGASAVYGSDAIGGVINIILTKDYDGVEARVRHSWMGGANETNASLAWGGGQPKAHISIIGTVTTRTQLHGFDRAIMADQDYSRFGGSDQRAFSCNLANVFSIDGSNLPGVGAPFAAVPAGYMGAPTQQEFSSTAGTLNKCSLGGYQSIIPETHRYGLSAAANYTFNSEIEGFAELMYSRVLEVTAVVPPLLYGAPGYQSYTMSASNPYNPFGETVGVSGLLSGLGQEATSFNTTFLRPLVGIRGRLLDRWHWELAGWMARDQSSIPTSNIINSGALQNALDSADPTHALNLFSPGSPTAGSVLQSVVYAPNQETATIEGRTVAANAFVSGTAFNLPSGPVNIVAGAEYDKDALRESGGIADGTPYPSTAFDRTSHAFFGEARVPIIRGPSSQHSDTLVLNVAGRYDSYSDFGHKLTPQFSAELRPTGSVLLRASYGKAFRAPPLGFVHATVLQLPYPIVDPQRGNQTEIVNLVYGGNPTLQPETGNSRTLGVVYTSDAIPGLRLSATNWQIDEHNSIQLLNPQVMVNNSDLFPGRVVRGPSQGGQLGPITDLTDTYVNFGAISVAGIDYQVSYKYQSRLGQMSPLISVTQTYRYSYALAPNAPGIDSLNNAQDAGTWAPRWKGNLQLGWERGPYSATVGSRYLGKYRDYDALPNGTFLSLGNFWLFDMSFRYAIGGAVARSNSWLRRTQLSVGASNVFNRLPQFSNTGGYGGYDPAEGDIRGRFLYAQLAIKW